MPAVLRTEDPSRQEICFLIFILRCTVSAGARKTEIGAGEKSNSKPFCARAGLPSDALTLWLRTYPVPFSHNSWRG